MNRRGKRAIRAAPRPKLRKIILRGRLTLVELPCKCKRPLVAIATGSRKVLFFDRPLAACPACEQRFPQVNLEELLQMIHAGP